MATIIIRNSTGSGVIPSSLQQGELAINTKDGKLFYGSGSGNIVKEFTGSGGGGGGPAFPFTGSATITGSLVITGSFDVGVPGTDNPRITSAGTLNRGDGISVDWINKQLIDSTPVISVDWESRVLNDTSEIGSVSWNERTLYDGSTGNVSVDWESRYLYDSTGARAYNYNARILTYPNNLSALNYGTQDQISMSGSVAITGSLTISGSSTFTNIGPAIFSGSVDSQGGFTGSLQGTASYATQALTASLAPNYVLNSATSSFVTNAQTSSFVLNSQTSSFVTNLQTSSFVRNNQTSSMSVATASTAPNAAMSIFGNLAGTGFTHPIVTYLPFGTTAVSATETQRQIATPMGGTLKNLYIRTNGAAVATSFTTFTIRINGVATNVKINISGGQAAGLYSDTINSASVILGDGISLQISTSIANGPQVNQYSFGIFNT